MFGAENLDPASINAQQVIIREIFRLHACDETCDADRHAPVTMFRSAEGERALTLGHVLKVRAELRY